MRWPCGGVIVQEVDAAEVVDVHTHLFAAAYGPPLMEFGIDALLTYHYVLAQACAWCMVHGAWCTVHASCLRHLLTNLCA